MYRSTAYTNSSMVYRLILCCSCIVKGSINSLPWEKEKLCMHFCTYFYGNSNFMQIIEFAFKWY